MLFRDSSALLHCSIVVRKCAVFITIYSLLFFNSHPKHLVRIELRVIGKKTRYRANLVFSYWYLNCSPSRKFCFLSMCFDFFDKFNRMLNRWFTGIVFASHAGGRGFESWPRQMTSLKQLLDCKLTLDNNDYTMP